MDADADGISDVDEGRASETDTDWDGTPDYMDTDSDDDCRSDASEAGDTDLGTAPVDTDDDGTPDFRDLDSDADGLSDETEDANCNGTTDTGESSALDDDTDNDGASDLVEHGAGTDPGDPEDNPEANGDLAFLVPYEGSVSPSQQDLAFATALRVVDVYALVDRSGTMGTEVTSIRDNLGTALDNLTCPPAGSGDPEDCIPDLWSGIGSIGYTGPSGAPYVNHLDLQSNPALTGPALATGESPGCCSEPTHLALWSTITGGSSTGSAGCSVADTYSSRASCAGSPAGADGLGYPCFRPSALPVVLLVTDETPSEDYDCPGAFAVVTAASEAKVRIIGITGSSPEPGTQGELEALAAGTGAVDATNGNAPLVFAGADANAATAIEDAVRALVNDATLDEIGAFVTDDLSDSVETEAAFIDHLETLQVDSATCADGQVDEDSNADAYPDTYRLIFPGTPLCWRLIAKANTTVAATAVPQSFRATIEILGEGVTTLDTRDVFFIVPPLPID